MRHPLGDSRRLWQNGHMDNSNDISEDLDRRIDTLTRRSTLTRSRIIEDALTHGRSLAWQEKWIAGVEGGLAAAERGDFVAQILRVQVGFAARCGEERGKLLALLSQHRALLLQVLDCRGVFQRQRLIQPVD